MCASAVSAVVAMLAVMTAAGHGQPLTPETVHCPLPFVRHGDTCVHSPQVETVIAASRHTRQTQSATQCPRCVPGVFELYPVWEDCSKVHYCLDGHSYLLDCRDFHAAFFNPVTKACESSATPSNVCLFRFSSVLLG